MTDREQAEAIRMVRAGIGYKKIATQLGLSANTVKSFCRKANEEKAKMIEASVCLNCGKDVAQQAHRKKKLFCSDRCRMQWWNAHRGWVLHRTTVKATCRFCGKEFESYGKQPRVYCSRECYDAARRMQRRERGGI